MKTFISFPYHSLVLIALILISTGSLAQFGIHTSKSIAPDEIEWIKSTKAIFFYGWEDHEVREPDEINKELEAKLDSILPKFWTLTPINAKHIKEYESYKDSVGYIFFGRANFSSSGSLGGSQPVYSNAHSLVEFWSIMVRTKKNGKIKRYRCDFGKYFLHNKFTSHWWLPGFHGNYLRTFQGHILNDKRRGEYDNVYIDKELKNLKTDTLYVPNYFYVNYRESNLNIEKYEPLFEDYPYNYKIIETTELDTMIYTSKKTLYYLFFTQDATDTYVSVFNSKTGEIIYSEYYAFTKSMKPTHIKKLAWMIDK